MKKIIYSLLFSLILVGGLFVGMVRGHEARERWISKMRNRYDDKKTITLESSRKGSTQVLLDEIEMATYHS
jgi:hypothetical protein